jgi:GGDEF domain-containing protein
VLLLKNVATAADAEPVVERLKRCACETILFNGTPLQVSATVGVAISELADQSVEDVVAAADRDMYARKRRRPK